MEKHLPSNHSEQSSGQSSPEMAESDNNPLPQKLFALLGRLGAKQVSKELPVGDGSFLLPKEDESLLEDYPQQSESREQAKEMERQKQIKEGFALATAERRATHYESEPEIEQTPVEEEE